MRRFVRAHEDADFDRILIGYFGNGADGFIVASYAAFVTERLGLMLAHRPGFIAPTLAARKLATTSLAKDGSRCISSPVETMPNRERMATT